MSNTSTPLFEKQEPTFSIINTSSIKPWTQTGANNVRSSINTLGVLTAILLRPITHPTYEYEVVDGTRRLDAITNNGEEHHDVPAFVLPATTTDLEAHAAAASLNLNRAVNPISEAKNFRTMINAGIPMETIAHQLGISISTIRARLKLLTLPDDILTAAENGLVATTAAQRITSLPPFIIERLQDTLATNNRITLEDVNDARKANRETAVKTLPAELFAPPPATDPVEILATHLRTAITQAAASGVTHEQIQSALEQALHSTPIVKGTPQYAHT